MGPQLFLTPKLPVAAAQDIVFAPLKQIGITDYVFYLHCIKIKISSTISGALMVRMVRSKYLSYIHLGSSVCHPVILSSCHPVIVAER
jgi:hypothetical protein